MAASCKTEVFLWGAEGLGAEELWGFFLLCLVTGLPHHSQAVADAPLSPRCAAEGSAWPSELCLTWEL